MLLIDIYLISLFLFCSVLYSIHHLLLWLCYCSYCTKWLKFWRLHWSLPHQRVPVTPSTYFE